VHCVSGPAVYRGEKNGIYISDKKMKAVLPAREEVSIQFWGYISLMI
jgi:hypothetical protein